MNQIFLTGRIFRSENTPTGKNLTIAIFQYEPDEIEYVPVSIDENSKVYIRDFRNGNLVSVIGRLSFKDKNMKILVEQINFAG